MSGDLTLDLDVPRGGRLDLNSVSGDVTVRLPDDVGLQVDVKTMSGSLRQRLPTAVDPQGSPVARRCAASVGVRRRLPAGQDRLRRRHPAAPSHPGVNEPRLRARPAPSLPAQAARREPSARLRRDPRARGPVHGPLHAECRHRLPAAGPARGRGAGRPRGAARAARSIGSPTPGGPSSTERAGRARRPRGGDRRLGARPRHRDPHRGARLGQGPAGRAQVGREGHAPGEPRARPATSARPRVPAATRCAPSSSGWSSGCAAEVRAWPGRAAAPPRTSRPARPAGARPGRGPPHPGTPRGRSTARPAAARPGSTVLGS